MLLERLVLVNVHRHFKPCASGCVKCRVQMLCHSVREGPVNYFDNVGDAFRKDKWCDQTSPARKRLVFVKKSCNSEIQFLVRLS